MSDAEHLKVGHMTATIERGPNATVVSVQETESGCSGACLMEQEAAALRDWLNAVLPVETSELIRENQAASDFIRGCIEALGIEQPPEGFTISLEALRLQIIGQIESLKGELVKQQEPPDRTLRLDRAEAEFIVDAAEQTRIPQWMNLAAEVRRRYGMGPFPAGAVSPQENATPPG